MRIWIKLKSAIFKYYIKLGSIKTSWGGGGTVWTYHNWDRIELFQLMPQKTKNQSETFSVKVLGVLTLHLSTNLHFDHLYWWQNWYQLIISEADLTFEIKSFVRVLAMLLIIYILVGFVSFCWVWRDGHAQLRNGIWHVATDKGKKIEFVGVQR